MRQARPGWSNLLWLLVTIPTGTSFGADVRLPEGIAPTFQSVTLRIDAREPRYEGSTSLAVVLDRPATEIELHSLVDVREAWLTDGQGKWRLTLREAGEDGVIALTAGRELPPGPYTLSMTFENDFNRQAVGLYRLEADGDWYTFTQFESTDARRAFPCFDEPAFKIPFEVILEVPAHDVALANTPEVSRTSDGDWVRIHFATTPPMPSYLVAVATGPFELVDVPDTAVPARIVTPRGQAHLAELAAGWTAPILSALEEWFGRPYPYAKLDQVAVPEFWPGAMENAGLITYRDNSLLLDPRRTTPGQRHYQVEVMAHEMAHQWFGNLVTMAWWDDLWLNEAFATWMEKKIGHQLLPEAGFEVDAVAEGDRAKGTDALATTRAIRQPVANAADLLQAVDILAYQKGERVLGMFEQWVGPQAFRRGVQRYLDEHAWGNATADDLWTALSAEASVDVGAAMSTFLDQPGIPLVTVEDLGRGRIRLTQERFHNHDTEVPTTMWQVPLRLRHVDADGVHETNVLLDRSSMELDLTGGAEATWLHPNAGASGYYRWTLPTERLVALAQSSGQELSLAERVELQGSIDAMLAAGVVGGADYLRLVQAQALDPHPRVMDGLLGSLDGVEFALVDEELRPAYAYYVRRFLEPSLARYGLTPTEGESDYVTELRAEMVETLLGVEDPEISSHFRATGEAFLDDPNTVHPTLVSASLRALCRDGDRALFDEVFSRFERAETPADRRRYLVALGYFDDPELLTAALDASLGPAFRPQEVMSVGRAASRSEEHRELLWRWLTQNYDAVLDRIPPPYTQYLVYSGLGCDEIVLERTKAFFTEKIAESPAIGGELPRLVERVADCISLREREGDAVRTYLLEVADLAHRN
jgi:alanyl aminopeptidase